MPRHWTALAAAFFILIPPAGATSPLGVDDDDDDDSGWVAESKEEPKGTKYETYRSDTIDAKASYLVYLPPGYDDDDNEDRRYPVVYWLHGLGQDQRNGTVFVELLDEAIRDDKAPPMIVVLPQAPPASFFVDAPGGGSPVATVILEDLIPHVDETYRTKDDAKHRAVEGYSMGGFGAAHLGFKHPDVFGAVSLICASVHRDEKFIEEHPDVFKDLFGGDEGAFEEISPWRLMKENADELRDGSRIRIWVGALDPAEPGSKDYHQRLDDLDIDHDYREVEGVSHNYRSLYREVDPDERFAFYRKAFD